MSELDHHGIIYMITSPSGKNYIGQTKNSLKERMALHCSKRSHCTILKSAIKKYGFNNMIIEVIWKGPVHKLPQQEQSFIKKHNTMAPFGYNCTSGGEEGKVYSLELRKKISDGGKRAIKEGRKQMPNNKGRKHSKTTKRKISMSISNYMNKNRKKNKHYRRKGTIYLLKAKNKWIAKGPCPRRKFLGEHHTKQEAEAALLKYTEEHPEEFD